MPKRRANGEGNIRKRKDGRWEGRYTIGTDPQTGKQIIKNVLARTQAEVIEKLKKAIQDSVGLDVNRADQYTVEQWMKLWFETYSKPNIRESTSLYYQNYMNKHIIPYIGSVALNKLTSLQIQQIYNKIKSGGRVKRYEGMTDLTLSNRVVRGVHMLLHN